MEEEIKHAKKEPAVKNAPERGAEKKALKKREGERGVEQEGRRGERRGGKL